MLTITVPYSTVQDTFTDQVYIQSLPTQIKERCTCIFSRDPTIVRGLKLTFERSDDRATNSTSSSESHFNWRLQISPAEFAWSTKQFIQSITKPPSESAPLDTTSGRGRVLDFLEAIINNVIPQSAGNKYRDVVPKPSPGENQKLSGQGKASRSPWHPCNIIFSTDFDCTCTIVDTCKILVRAAEVAALKRPGKESLPLWQPGNFNRDYRAALKRHVERTRKTIQTLFLEHKGKDINKDCEEICLTESEVKSFPEEHHDDQKTIVAVKAISSKLIDGVMFGDGKPSPYREPELRIALTKLAMLEIMCNQDVISLGVLRGPTREEIRAEAAMRVRLRAQCAKVMQRLAHTGTAIHVVSANWSRDLIVAGLPKLSENRLFVHSNDLIFDSIGRSIGMIDGKVVDAFDKEELLRALRCTYDSGNQKRRKFSADCQSNKKVHGGEADSEVHAVLVYVGDSHTDLLGLLEADLGIVIGESLLMRRIMALFGIQLRPLAEASTRISVARVSNSMLSYRRSGLLFETRSWTDVEACLFGEKAEVQP